MTKNTNARMIPITARIQAMFTAAPAMPLKPKIAATTAMTRKITAQFSISGLLFKLSERWRWKTGLVWFAGDWRRPTQRRLKPIARL
jgi:hypothetical protein